ncbi:LppU family putative lipoprotein [Gordonia oryzae]|uniref:LppU family putative lipoprotein n=1 Tax=Gordonia oryzae TaxID=2487349 RepID=UPI001FE47AE1|nr:hypothetical protein [Gordonia oryzae]
MQGSVRGTLGRRRDHPPGPGGDVDFDAAIGACVYLSGTMMDAKIDHATCGQAPASYVVVAKSPTKEVCPSDVEQTYYLTQGGIQQGALCLDTDWVVGQCMTVPSFGDAAHVPCSSTIPTLVAFLPYCPQRPTRAAARTRPRTTTPTISGTRPSAWRN